MYAERKARTFRELLSGESVASIRSLPTGEVVRRLKVTDGDHVEIDALTVKVTVPLDTRITYEPWDFDRGSLLFALPAGQGTQPLGKICTELDILEYVNGTRFSIVPGLDS